MNEKIYKTGLMNDPALTDRLYECGATFTKDIDQQASPILSFLVTGLLPLIIFIVLGNDRKRCKTAEKEIRDIDIKGFRNRRKH